MCLLTPYQSVSRGAAQSKAQAKGGLLQWGQVDALLPHLKRGNPDAITRSNDIAEVFRFIHRQKFEDVAKAMSFLSFGTLMCSHPLRRSGRSGTTRMMLA